MSVAGAIRAAKLLPSTFDASFWNSGTNLKKEFGRFWAASDERYEARDDASS
jgi:hypothetical protein